MSRVAEAMYPWKYRPEADEDTALEMDEQSMQDALLANLTGDDSEFDFSEDFEIHTFEQEGVMTYNKGLVITCPDGSEFQVTIVQSR